MHNEICKRIIAKLLIVVVLAFFLPYGLQLLKKQHALFVYAEKKNKAIFIYRIRKSLSPVYGVFSFLAITSVIASVTDSGKIALLFHLGLI